MFPDLFSIGPVTLHTYGLFVAVGFLVGLMVTMRIGRAEGITPQQIMDIGFLMIVAAIVIVILLLITFRGPLGLLAMLPLLAGSAMMLGCMAIFGMKYNFMNFMAIPVILGIGIDDGVHALHRYQENTSEGTMRVYDSYRFVGRAILLTTLTTMIGFGGLLFAHHRGLASLGWVMVVVSNQGGVASGQGRPASSRAKPAISASEHGLTAIVTSAPCCTWTCSICR